MYFYRCTEQQLGEALDRIHGAGDTLITAVFKGGRDWVLICRKNDVHAAVDAGRFGPGGDLA